MLVNFDNLFIIRRLTFIAALCGEGVTFFLLLVG